MAGKFYAPVTGVTPKPAKYGLLNSKTLVDTDQYGRWEGGISIDSLFCNVLLQNIEVCDPSHKSVVQEPRDTENEYIPFVVSAEFTCSTFGFNSNDFRQKALDAIEAVQGKAIEHELWTGELSEMDNSTSGGNPNKYLASADADNVTPTSGAVSVALGVALLEKALADSGAFRGYIHAPRGAASIIAGDLEDEGDVLKTKLGTYVIAGTGYGDTGPTGDPVASDTEAWLYATGPVAVLLSDVETVPNNLSEAVNTKNNSVTYVAQRTAAVVWDGCGHFAVRVDLTK